VRSEASSVRPRAYISSFSASARSKRSDWATRDSLNSANDEYSPPFGSAPLHSMFGRLLPQSRREGIQPQIAFRKIGSVTAVAMLCEEWFHGIVKSG